MEAALRGETEQPKEYALGVEVFNRDGDFDPRLDSVVRVEFNRLRARLSAYYESAGAEDAWIIEVPAGAYVAHIRRRPPPAQPQPESFWRRPLVVWAATSILLPLAVALGWVLARSRGGPETGLLTAPLSQVTLSTGLVAYPALSPDGRWLVYSSDQPEGKSLRLWIQPLAGGPARRMTGASEGDETEASFSADGQTIAYRSSEDGGGVYLLPVAGGEPELVEHFGRSPRFAPTGRRLMFVTFSPHTGLGELHMQDLEERVPPVRFARDFEDLHTLAWAPDGRAVMACGTRVSGKAAEEHDLWIVPVPGGTPVKTGAFDIFKRQKLIPHAGVLRTGSMQWLRDRVLIVLRNDQGERIWSLPAPDQAGHIRGEATAVAPGVGHQLHPAAAGDNLAFSGVQSNVDIWSIPVDADSGQVQGAAERLTTAPEDELLPGIDRDGTRLVYLSRRVTGPPPPEQLGDFVVWAKDIPSGVERQLSPAGLFTNRLKLTQDATEALYRILDHSSPRHQSLYASRLDGSGTTLECEDCGAVTHAGGQYILFETGHAVPRIGVFDPATRQRAELLEHTHHAVRAARFSPDRQLVAFHLDRGPDGRQILVAPFHGMQPSPRREWREITQPETRDFEPWWSPGGRMLYFISERDGNRCIWRQAIDPATGRPQGEPAAVQHFHQVRLSMLTHTNYGASSVGFSVSRHRLVVALDSLSGNIWLGKLRR